MLFIIDWKSPDYERSHYLDYRENGEIVWSISEKRSHHAGARVSKGSGAIESKFNSAMAGLRATVVNVESEPEIWNGCLPIRNNF